MALFDKEMKIDKFVDKYSKSNYENFINKLELYKF